jgi:SGNH domain (fused to AT3 domains)
MSQPATSELVAYGHDERGIASQHRRHAQEETDRLFAAALPNDVTTYVSIYRALCDKKCALWANGRVPLQSDYGHLTAEGSLYLASKIGSQFLEKREVTPTPLH